MFVKDFEADLANRSTYLVDVGALNLRHRDEMVRQQEPVVLADAAHLGQTLVTVEEELFTEMLQLLRLLGQHVPKRFLFVAQKFVLPSDQVVLGTLEAPAGDVLRTEQLLLALDYVALFLDKVLLDLFAEGVQLAERLVLCHVVLQMTAQVHLEEIAEVGDVVAGASAHFGQPGVKLVQSVNSDHVIDVAKFLEVLAECVHRFRQLCTLFLDLLSGLDDLLVENLVAVSEVVHARAEDHRVLVHIHAHLALLGHQFHDGLAVLGLLEDFVGLLELFQVFDLQKVDQADGRLELLTA